MTSASSAGLLPTGVVPSSLRRVATSGDLRILPISPLSLSMIGCGVPAGASIAFQATISNPGTNSEMAGMSGADGERPRLEMPSGAQRAAAHVRHRRGHHVEADADGVADQRRRQLAAAAAERHVMPPI